MQKGATRYIKQYLDATCHKTATVTATYHPSWKPSKLDEQDMWDTAGWARFSYGLLHMNARVLDDKLELIYNSSALQSRDVTWEIYRKRGIIETGSKREMIMMIIYIYIYIYIYIQDFTLNNQQWLICRKTQQTNQSTNSSMGQIVLVNNSPRIIIISYFKLYYCVQNIYIG